MQETTTFWKSKMGMLGKWTVVGAVLTRVVILALPSLSSNPSTLGAAMLTNASRQSNTSTVHFQTRAEWTALHPGEIPSVAVRNAPLFDVGLSRNPEVVLTDSQFQVVKAFDAFLQSRGECAVITSGKRTSEGQLNIIKERIAEHGATARFPKLESASIFDTKIWLKAWQWLRRKRVPVNAPAEVPGTAVRTSMHLKGLAIDFISTDLDHLRSLLADFSRSSYASNAPLQIASIVREPGCVHINLT